MLCVPVLMDTAWKSAMLVLECFYKVTGDREEDLWRLRLPEGCITNWYDKPTGYGCLSKKSWLGEQWSSDIAVSCTLAKQSNIHSENTRFETLWFSPLTRISINVTVSSRLHLLFLTFCPAVLWVNIFGCHQDMKLLWIGPIAYKHTGFYYSKLLTYLSYVCGSFSNISGINFGWDWV
jgi:hypothetical protein